MIVSKHLIGVSGFALCVLLTSCGSGDSSSEGPSENPAYGSANAVGESSAGNISGRVADGYIKGASVCVDMNDSNTCDEGEPTAVTGDGGAYDLTLPVGAEDKAIVASIPATAIDEDTGEPIGKALVFSAPADKPEFVSPITTLVHHQLRSNPSLSVDDAEAAVKLELGVSDENISLFDDFVAGANNANTETKDEFRYLHDTARVVTSMMKDIETQVGQAAVSKGIDVVGDVDTQQAIRELVRTQVRELLPEIARRVTELASTESEPTDGENASSGLNPEQIAQSLRPEGVKDFVEERIDAALEQATVQQLDLKVLLAEGLFVLEIECHETSYLGSSSADACEAYYTDVQLTSAEDELITDEYTFDEISASWQKNVDDGDNHPRNLVLDSGQWNALEVPGAGADPIHFAADGSATLTDAQGETRLSAVTRDLSAKSVQSHLFASNANPEWFDLVAQEDFFPAGAQAHVVSLKTRKSPYVLFNNPPVSEYGADPLCGLNHSNCNLISSDVSYTGDEETLPTYASLMDIQRDSLFSVDLRALWNSFGPALFVTLTGESGDDGAYPQAGVVTWVLPHEQGARTYGEDIQLAQLSELDQCYKDLDVLIEKAPANTGQPDDDDYFITHIVPAEENCALLEQMHYTQFEPAAALPATESTLDTMNPEFLTKPLDISNPEMEACFELLTGIEAQGPAGTEPSDYEEFDHVVEEKTAECFTFGNKTPIDPATQTQSETEEIDELGQVIALGAGSPYTPAASKTRITSAWEMIQVDGVSMLLIHLPDAFRFNTDDNQQAFILSEHDGYVRLGVQLPEIEVREQTVYNRIAFDTLRYLIEAGPDSL